MNKEKYIIEKAKALFSEIGYKGTTMDLLASKCDMGKGTLYLYYSSKEEVLKSIVNQLIETIKEKADLIDSKDGNFNEQIMKFLHEMLNLKKEQIMVAKLVFEAKQLGNQVVNKYIEQIDNYIMENLTSRIDKAIKDGFIKENNPEFLSFIIYKVYMSLVLEWEEKSSTKLTEKELFCLVENILK